MLHSVDLRFRKLLPVQFMVTECRLRFTFRDVSETVDDIYLVKVLFAMYSWKLRKLNDINY